MEAHFLEYGSPGVVNDEVKKIQCNGFSGEPEFR